jgi:hypothetical protein
MSTVDDGPEEQARLALQAQGAMTEFVTNRGMSRRGVRFIVSEGGLGTKTPALSPSRTWTFASPSADGTSESPPDELRPGHAAPLIGWAEPGSSSPLPHSVHPGRG